MNALRATLRPVQPPTRPKPPGGVSGPRTAPAAPALGPNRPSDSHPIAPECPADALSGAQDAPQRSGGIHGPAAAQRAPEADQGAPGAPLRLNAPTLAAALGALATRPTGLSDRERGILALLAHGSGGAAIARSLGLGERAAKTRLHRMFGVLGAANGAHAVALGHQRGDLAAEPLDASVTGPLLDVLALVARGCTNEEIARALWLSADGAKHRMRRLFEATGARNRPNLVHRGFGCGALGSTRRGGGAR